MRSPSFYVEAMAAASLRADLPAHGYWGMSETVVSEKWQAFSENDGDRRRAVCWPWVCRPEGGHEMLF